MTLSEKSLSRGPSPISASQDFTDSGVFNGSLLSSTDNGEQKDKKRTTRPHSQPPNTTTYTVGENEKLTTIAALYDTTPSCIRKLNKMAVDFLYPGQLLYVPERRDQKLNDYENSLEINDSSCQTGMGQNISSTMTSSSTSEGSQSEQGAFSVDEQSLSSAEHATPLPSVSSSSGLEDSKLSMQRFIKLHSKYITVGQGVVDGTLLVTPNAVMFDPNVSDPLVKENGDDEYGVVAKMETVVAAAIYRDVEAVLAMQHNVNCGEKPEIYHTASCNINRSKPDDETATEEHTDDLNSNIETSGSAVISCSCGADNGFSNSFKKNRTHSSELFPLVGSTDSSSRLSNDTSSRPITRNNSSQVKFDLDNDATSSPIRCNSKSTLMHMRTQFSIDDINEEGHYHTGPSSVEEGLSISVEHRLSALPKRFTHKRSDSTSSSIYNVSLTDQTEVYIDFSSGLFAKGSVPNFNNLSANNWKNQKSTDSCTADLDSTLVRMSSRSMEDVSSRQQAADLNPNCLSVNDKHHRLFKSVDALIPELLYTHKHYSDEEGEPYYLCLQVAKPMNKSISDACPYESYNKRQKPVYWFTVPAHKVDDLYTFFIQWEPERYREKIEDDETLSKRGFLPIRAEDISDRVSQLPCTPSYSFSNRYQVYKDWEIVSLTEIIKRKSLLDIDKYLPMPELNTESSILTEDNIRQLAGSLPVRLEGFVWSLVFSNSLHGYNLNTLFRKTAKLDMPVLLVIRDTDGNVFGAFSTTSFRLSDHFSGTGECFLFTCADEFKAYKWSGKNLFCSHGAHGGLTIGTGRGTCGLWIDEDLNHGRTQCCETFNNDILTKDKEDFIIDSVEVWTFTDDDDDLDNSTQQQMFEFVSL